MIYGFYYRFYKVTKAKGVSIVLAYMARFVFFIRYLVQKMFTPTQIVEMDEDTALDIIKSVSPDPAAKPEYTQEIRISSIDLSVIIPVYNHVNDISECINSVINQKTRFSFEIILVDDGSTDGAELIVDHYKEAPNIRVYHQANKGIAAARNTGIELAHGQYLMFVDCDDKVHQDIVEKLLDIAYSENSDIVMGAHNLVKKTNGVVTSVIPNIQPEQNLLGYKNGDEIMNYAGLPWGKVYKRELFENVRFFPGYWYEDTIIQGLLFFECRHFSYVPQVLYDYNWNEYNFSHVQDNKKLGKAKTADRYWLLAAIAYRYEELGLPQDAKFYTMLLKHVSAYYYGTIASMPEEFISAMFFAARSLLLKYRPSETIKLPYMLRETEKAILNKDLAHWKLCSVNQ